ncbi:MAG: PEP-CTERM sorting domain-containing protein [Thiobacillus sp.]
MNQSSSPKAVRRAVALACASLFACASGSAFAAGAIVHKNWTSTGTNNPTLSGGGSLDVTGFTGGQNNWTSNTGTLANAAWAHSGGSPWFAFNLTGTADVSITVTNAQANAWQPGMTVWASGAAMFDGGTGDATDVGQVTGFNSPHTFNQVGSVGSAGTLWMTGANGNMLETLAYANAGNVYANAATNDWNLPILGGVNDVSISSTYESGIGGSIGSGTATLTFNDMQAGWYTIFVGGANSLGNSTFNLAVVAVPEPQTYAMFGAGLMMLAGAARRRARKS